MVFKFFLTSRSVNEATDFYIGLIERAILAAGYPSQRVFSLKEIVKADVVITIEAKDFCRVKLFRPGRRQVNWFQGIVPEEAMMMFNSTWRKMLWELFERITLANAKLNIFVSVAMKQHYTRKYGYHGNQDLVIPCYNKPLKKAAFFIDQKYTRASFVYAGSLAAWQCVTETLAIYKGVEAVIPEANLTLLTSDQDAAEVLVKKHGIKNYEIRFCPLNLLDEELAKYKYGFLIREQHIVNEVATPTKMNSYLASGIIPIFSDVVTDFRKHIDLNGHEAIRIDPAASLSAKVAQIIDFEKNIQVSPPALYERYQKIFNDYYNDEVYIIALSKKIKELMVC